MNRIPLALVILGIILSLTGSRYGLVIWSLSPLLYTTVVILKNRSLGIWIIFYFVILLCILSSGFLR